MSGFVYKVDPSLSTPYAIRWFSLKKRSADKAGISATGISAAWQNVKSAKGYQCKFYVLWPDNKKYAITKNVKKCKASAYFQDNNNIRLLVRYYKYVNGVKVYSPWAESLIKKELVSIMAR